MTFVMWKEISYICRVLVKLLCLETCKHRYVSVENIYSEAVTRPQNPKPPPVLTEMMKHQP